MFLAKVSPSLLRVADFIVAELRVPELILVGLLRVLAKNAVLCALVRYVAAFSSPLEAI